jgi:hypothetical protein
MELVIGNSEIIRENNRTGRQQSKFSAVKKK